jgi:hypothetical protein
MLDLEFEGDDGIGKMRTLADLTISMERLIAG